MASGRRSCRVSETGAGARPGTRCPASCDHPRCRGQATCVPGPGHCQPPGGRRDHSSVRGCGVKSRVAHGNPADRIREGKKSFCCVTTRRRKFWLFNGRGRSLGTLAALALCLGVTGFGVSLLAMLGLPPRRLPATDLLLAFRLLAVALVPASWLVPASAAFTQAGPRAGPAPPGQTTAFALNVVGAHGRCFSQG
jgi:hypothetical protein